MHSRLSFVLENLQPYLVVYGELLFNGERMRSDTRERLINGEDQGIQKIKLTMTYLIKHLVLEQDIF